MKLLATGIALCVFIAPLFSQNPDGGDVERYRRELEVNPRGSLAHFRLGETYFQQKNLQSAALEFARALDGDHEPAWTVVWSHINLAKIFLASAERDRARTELALAARTGDDTGGAIGEAAALSEGLADPAFSPQPGQMADDLPLPPGAYRIGNGVAGPVPIQKTEPVYSPEARLAGLEGTVIVTGVIDEDGSQRDMRVTRPLGAGLDRKALEAVARWRFKPGTYWDRPIRVFASFAIDFRLPAKQSRWHLTQAEFTPEEGASRPVFTNAFYPAGAGIGPDAVEEGQVIGATGRVANATVLFDIDERGVPIHFQVRNSSADVWGPEAIRVVSAWRFKPGIKPGVNEGKPVSTPAAFTLAWAPEHCWRARKLQCPGWPGHPPLAGRA
jgi:TonB family protein